ncbi:MAG: hypothetical protein ACRCW2_09340 [Cellulosilyticaceae bacterium]
MKKKVIIMILMALVLGIGNGCSMPDAQQVADTQGIGEDYKVQVKGLKLKYVLVDSAFEIYQMQGEFKEFTDDYLKYQRTHYEWMMATYEDMSTTMRESLAMIMTKTHPWQIMNVTSSLIDDASVEEVIQCIINSDQLPYNQADREAIDTFFTTYYERYLEAYLETQIPLFEEKAEKLNAAIQQHDSDIMSFMEQASGISFDEKRKPVFYYTLRGLGAMGFEQPGVKISLIQRSVSEISNLFNTPFHEFSHSLFDTFTEKHSFKKVAKQLAREDKVFRQIWESRFHTSYDWIGWCEENLVEGFASYLSEKYYGYPRESGIYTYDLAFYYYLKEIEFDPSKISLEKASIDFYKKVLTELKAS